MENILEDLRMASVMEKEYSSIRRQVIYILDHGSMERNMERVLTYSMILR